MIEGNTNLTTIIEVAGEGGSISILSKKETGVLEYTIAINESDLLDFFEEEINETREKDKEYNWVKDWNDVLDRFCNYSITKLYPIYIEPEYAVSIWSKLKDQKDGIISRRWLQKLKEQCPNIVILANWIKNSNYTVILTGAGMSTESGIPDFRSKNGMWKGIDPMKVATKNSLINNYDLFHEFYSIRSSNLEDRKPHIGYEILAKWESDGLINSIITQNVDDFHLIAGNKNVIRLHGSLNEFRCDNCGVPHDKELFMYKVSCEKCGGNLRPGVVLFGEGLTEEDLIDATKQIERAELVIIIGTSLMVYPVSQLPNLTNGKVVYINKDIEGNQYFDMMFSEKAGEILSVLDDIISKHSI